MACLLALGLLLCAAVPSTALLSVEHKPAQESEYDFTATWRFESQGQDIQLLAKVHATPVFEDGEGCWSYEVQLRNTTIYRLLHGGFSKLTREDMVRRLAVPFHLTLCANGTVTHVELDIGDDPTVIGIKQGVANHFHAELPESVHVSSYARHEDHESGRSLVNYTAMHHGDHTVVTRATIMQGHHRNRDQQEHAIYSAPIDTRHVFDHRTRAFSRTERRVAFQLQSVPAPRPGDGDIRHGRVPSPPMPAFSGDSSLVLTTTRPATKRVVLSTGDQAGSTDDESSSATSTAATATTTPSPHVLHHVTGRRRRDVPGSNGAVRTVESHGLVVDKSGGASTLWLSDQERARINALSLDALVEAALYLDDRDERSVAFQDLLLFLEQRGDQFTECVRTVRNLPTAGSEAEQEEWKLLVAAVLTRGTPDAQMLSLQLLEKVLQLPAEVQAEMVPLNLHVLVQMHLFTRPTADFVLGFKLLTPMLDAVEPQLREGVLLAWGSILRNVNATHTDPAALQRETEMLAGRARAFCDANDTSATVPAPCEQELSLLTSILANVATEQALDMVLDLITHRSAEVRGQAVLAAASFKQHRSLQTVLRSLAHDGHVEVQRRVLHALRIMSRVEPTDSIAALDNALHDCMQPRNLTTQLYFCKAIVETAKEIAKESPWLKPRVEAMEKTLQFAFVGTRVRRSPSLRGLTIVDEQLGSEQSNSRIYGTSDFGGFTSMILRNIAAIKIGLFDGFFEIDILDSFRAGLNVYFFRIDLAELTVSFNFAASYKNPTLIDALYQDAVIATPYLDAVGSAVTKVIQTIQAVATACNQFLSTPIAVANGLNGLVADAQAVLSWLNNVTSWARVIQPQVDALTASSPTTTSASTVRGSLTPVVTTVNSAGQVDTQLNNVTASALNTSAAFNASLPALSAFSTGFAGASPTSSQGLTAATAANMGTMQNTANSVNTYYDTVAQFNNSPVWANPASPSAPLGTLTTANNRTNASIASFPPTERAAVATNLRAVLNTSYPTQATPSSIAFLQTLRGQLVGLQQGLVRYGPIIRTVSAYASSIPSLVNFVRTTLPLEAINSLQPTVQSFVTTVAPPLLTTITAVQGEIANLRSVMDTFTNSIDASVASMSQYIANLLQSLASSAGVPSLVTSLQDATKGLLGALGATSMGEMNGHLNVLDRFSTLRDPFQQLQNLLTTNALDLAQTLCNNVAGFLNNILTSAVNTFKTYLKLLVEFSLSLPASMGVSLDSLHDVSNDVSDAIDKLGDMAEKEMQKYATDFCTDLGAVRTFLASIMAILNSATSVASTQIRQDLQYLFNNTARFVLPVLDWASLSKSIAAAANNTFDQLVTSTLQPFRSQVQTLRATFTTVSATIDTVKTFVTRLNASQADLLTIRSRVPAISNYIASLTSAKSAADAAVAGLQGASASRVQTYLKYMDRSIKGIDSIVALYGAGGSASNASCVPGAPCTATFMMQLLSSEAANFRALWTSLSNLQLNDTSLSGLQATLNGLTGQTSTVMAGFTNIKSAYPQFAAAVAAIANVKAADQATLRRRRRRRDLGSDDEPAHARARRAAAAAGCGMSSSISFAVGIADMLANTCTMATSARSAVSSSQSALASFVTTIDGVQGKAAQFSGALAFLKNAATAAQSPLQLAGTSLDTFVGAFGPIAAFLRLDFSSIFNLVKYSSFATSFFAVLDPARTIVDSVKSKTQGLVDVLNTARRALVSFQAPGCPDWSTVRGCSSSLCLCTVPRVENYAKELIFPLKYSHLFAQSYQDGGSMNVIPGLYNDFTPRGVIALDGNTIISYEGFGQNSNKAVLAVLNGGGTLLKIYLLTKPDGSNFIGGGDLAIAGPRLYIATGAFRLGHVLLADVRAGLGNSAPSSLTTRELTTAESATSVAYEVHNGQAQLWIGDVRDRKRRTGTARAVAYAVFTDGSLDSQQIGRAYHGSDVRGMAIVVQASERFMAVSRCAYSPGYSCSVQFLSMKYSYTSGNARIYDFWLSTSGDITQAVRMPMGSEGLHWQASTTKIHGYLYSVFSSESNMMVPVTKQLKMLGEDRYFIWNTPVMRSDPGTVKSNYLYWMFLGNRIASNTAVVPGLGYRRPRRDMQTSGGTLFSGSITFFTAPPITFVVVAIPVSVAISVSGLYGLGYSMGFDLAAREAEASLTAYFTAVLRVAIYIDLFVVRAGVEILAYFFSITVGPELKVSLISRLHTCFAIKGTFTALRIDISFFYQIFFCFYFRSDWCCKVEVGIEWCAPVRWTFFTWRTPTRAFYLLGPFCTGLPDRTSPELTGFVRLTQVLPNAVQYDVVGVVDDESEFVGCSVGLQYPYQFIEMIDIAKATSMQVNYTYLATGSKGSGVVRCCNILNLCSTWTTNEIVFDTSPPVVLGISDGSSVLGNIDYTSSPTYAAAWWPVFDLEGNGIYFLMYALFQGQNMVIPWEQYYGQSNSFQNSTEVLLHNRFYSTCIMVSDNFNNVATSCTDGFRVDLTPPRFRRLYEGGGATDAAYSPRADAAIMRFDAAIDVESFIGFYEVSLLERASLAVVVPYTNIGTSNRVAFSGLSLVHNREYFFRIIAYNRAGLTTMVYTNGFRVDLTPPYCSALVNTFFNVTRFNASVTVLSSLAPLQSYWACEDGESGIPQVDLALGRDSVGTSALPWTSVRSPFVWPITLFPAATYYSAIRARNGADVTLLVLSEGVAIDVTAPVLIPTYVLAAPLMQTVTTETSFVQCLWPDAYLDLESPWVYFRVGLFVAAPGTDIRAAINTTSMALVDVGPLTSYKFNTLTLLPGSRVYCVVEARNQANLASLASSIGVLVDNTAPIAGAVLIESSASKNKAYLQANVALSVTWQFCNASDTACQAQGQGFYDVESAISFSVALREFVDGPDITVPLAVGVKQNALLMGNFLQGQDLYAVVYCTNEAGLVVEAVSNLMSVDLTPPDVFSLMVSNAALVAQPRANITASWYASDFESDVLQCVASLGLFQGDEALGRVVLPNSPINTYAVAFNNVVLENGVQYYLSLVCENNANAQTRAFATAVLCDLQPPTLGTITDGVYTSFNPLFQYSNTSLSASWQYFVDQESGLASIEIGVSSTGQPQPDVAAFISIGIYAQSFVFQNLSLVNGGKYSVVLRLTDLASNVRVAVSSGIKIDSTAPLFLSPIVHVGGVGNNSQYSQSGDFLSMTVGRAVDPDTEIVSLRYAVGTAQFQTNVRDWTPMVADTSVQAYALALTDGVTYYFSVYAENQAGLRTIVSSQGLTVFARPPTCTAVGGTRLYQRSSATLTLQWSCFHAVTASLAMGSDVGLADLLPFTARAQPTFSLTNATLLVQGAVFYFTLSVVGPSGLAWTGLLATLSVDNTPPIAQSVADAVQANGRDGQFQTSLTRVTYKGFWYDIESDIAHITVCVGQVRGACDLLAPTAVPADAQAGAVDLPSGTSLVPFRVYYLNVTVFNNVNLSASIASDGFFADNTPPACNLSMSAPLQSSTSYLAWTWACRDPESSVSRVSVQVINNATGFMFINELLPGPNGTYSLGGLALNHSEIYRATVAATNGAGGSAAYFDMVTIDTTAPLAYVVSLTLNTTANILAYTLQCSDAESGVVQTNVSVVEATSQAATGLQALVDSQTTIQAWFNASLLTQGISYLLAITVSNRAGLDTRFFSPLITVDLTPPDVSQASTTVALRYPAGLSGNVSSISGLVLLLFWQDAVDSESGIAAIGWALNRNNTETAVTWLASRDQNLVTAPINVTARVSHRVRLFFRNGAGLVSSILSSTFVPDVTGGLIPGEVVLGSSRVSALSSNTTILASWTPCTTASSIDITYTVSFGTDASSTALQTIIAGARTSVVVSLVSPLPTASYVVATVTCTASDNRVVTFSSPAKMVDPSAPVVQNVTLLATNGRFVESLTTVVVCWNVQDPESGVASVEVALLFPPAVLSDATWLPVDSRGCAVLSNLSLTNGAALFAGVRATNGAGLATVATSAVAFVDVTPPLVGTVRPSTYFLSGGSLSVDVVGFDDLECDTKFLSVAVGTAPGVANVQPWLVVPNASSTRFALTDLNVSLPANSSLFITVIAENYLGRITQYSAQPILIDLVPPTLPALFDGPSNANATRATGSVLSASWLTPFDVGSGIFECNLTFTDNLGVIVGVKYNVELDLAAAVPAIAVVRTGAVVRATLRCSDFAGLATSLSTTGIVYDNTPPTLAAVRLLSPGNMLSSRSGSSGSGSGQPLSVLVLTNASIAISLAAAAVDLESGIDTTEWTVCVYASQACVRSFVPLVAAVVADASLPLVAGQLYTVRVRASNLVGLVTVVDSPAFIIDGAPPTAGVVNSKTGDYAGPAADLAFTWSGFTDDTRIANYSFCLQRADEPLLACSLAAPAVTQDPGVRLGSQLTSAMVTDVSYLFLVWAIDDAGRIGNPAMTSFVFDAVPPSAGQVLDAGDGADCSGLLGPIVDASVQTHTDVVVVCWRGFSDSNGLQSFTVALGSAPGLTDLRAPETYDATAGTAALSLSSNVQGTVVYGTVVAIDMAGNRNSSSSNGVLIVPSSAAFTPNVTLTGAFNGFVRQMQDRVNVTWSDLSLLFGGRIAFRYSWALCDMALPIELCVFQPLGSRTSISTLIDQPLETTAIVRIIGSSSLPTSYYMSSSPLYVTSAADVGSALVTAQLVQSGVVSLNNVFATSTGLQLQWFTTPTSISSMFNYYVCFTANVTTCVTNGAPLASNRLSADLSTSPLSNAVTTTLSLVSYLGSTAVSVQQVTVTVDGRPPTMGRVFDCLSCRGVAPTFTTGTLLTASWETVIDVGSGLAACTLSFLDDSNNTLATLYSVQTLLAAFAYAPNITDGTRVRAALSCVDNAGLVASTVSRGITYDSTPPLAGTIVFVNATTLPAGASNLISGNITLLSSQDVAFSLVGFGDRESGLPSVVWSLCLVDRSSCVVAPSTIFNLSSIVEPNVALQLNELYVLRVTATNGAGLSVDIESPPLALDLSAPVTGALVVLGSSSALPTLYLGSRSNTTLRAAGFTDDVRISSFTFVVTSLAEPSVDTSNTSTTTLNTTATPTSTTLTTPTSATVTSTTFATTANRTGNATRLNTTSTTNATVTANTTTTPTAISFSSFTFVSSSNQFAPNRTLWAQLTSSGKYQVAVYATDYAGRVSDTVILTFFFDDTAPLAGLVLDEGSTGDCSGGIRAARDADVQLTGTVVAACWRDFADSDGEIERFLVSVGSACNRSDVAATRSLDSSVLRVAVPTNLTLNQSVFVTVQAIDGAGNQVSVCSNGVRYITIPPPQGSIWHVLPASNDTTNVTTYSARTGNYNSDPSNIYFAFNLTGGLAVNASVAVFDELLNEYVSSWIELDPAQLDGTTYVQAFEHLTLMEGGKYHAVLAVTSGAGSLTAQSASVVVSSAMESAQLVVPFLESDLRFIPSPVLPLDIYMTMNTNFTNTTAYLMEQAVPVDTVQVNLMFHSNETLPDGVAEQQTSLPTAYLSRFSACCVQSPPLHTPVTVASHSVLSFSGAVSPGANLSNVGQSLVVADANTLLIAATGKVILVSKRSGALRGTPLVNFAFSATNTPLLASSATLVAGALNGTVQVGALVTVVAQARFDATVPALTGLAAVGRSLALDEASRTLAVGYAGGVALFDVSVPSSPQSLVRVTGGSAAFGVSVDIQSARMVVGVVGTGQAVYHAQSGANWAAVRTVTVGAGGDPVVRMIAADRDVFAVAVPTALGGNGLLSVFRNSTAVCNLTGPAGSLFGASIAVVRNGTKAMLAVGAPQQQLVVMVHVDLTTLTCTQLAALQPDADSVNSSLPSFGSAVAFGPGQELLIGYPTFALTSQGSNATVGAVFHATFCAPNSRHVQSAATFFDATCIACAPGTQSHGGDAFVCDDCVNAACLNVSNAFRSNFSQSLRPMVNYSVQVDIIFQNHQAITFRTGYVEYDPTPPALVSIGDGYNEIRNCTPSANATAQCTAADQNVQDVEFQVIDTRFSANFRVEDPESGVVAMAWCFSRTRSLACDLWPMTNVTLLNTTSATISTAPLGNGARVYFAVCANNGAGASACYFSNGVRVDMTPPDAFDVIDGPVLPDLQFQSFIDSLVGAALNVTDAESGIAEMFWCAETATGHCDVIPYHSIGANLSVWYESGLDLVPGDRYHIRITAVNGAGLSTEGESDGVVVGRNKVVLSDVVRANKTKGVTMMFDALTLAQEDAARRRLNSTNSSSIPTPVPTPPVFGTIDLPDSEVKRAGDKILQAATSAAASKDPNIGSDLPEGFQTTANKTMPRGFVFGDYSFQLNMLDPDTNERVPHYTFSEPVTLKMFVSLDNIVKNNGDVLRSAQPAIAPKLQLWDDRTGLLIDASLTCPVPFSAYDFATNILTVKICHFSQYMLYVDISRMSGAFGISMNNSNCRGMYARPTSVDVVRYDGAVGSSRVTVTASCSSRGPTFASNLTFIEGEWQKTVSFPIPSTGCLTPTFSVTRLVNGTIRAASSGSCAFIAPPVVTPSSDASSSSGGSSIVPIAAGAAGGAALVAVIAAVLLVRRRRRQRLQPSFTDTVVQSSAANPTKGANQGFAGKDGGPTMAAGAVSGARRTTLRTPPNLKFSPGSAAQSSKEPRQPRPPRPPGQQPRQPRPPRPPGQQAHVVQPSLAVHAAAPAAPAAPAAVSVAPTAASEAARRPTMFTPPTAVMNSLFAESDFGSPAAPATTRPYLEILPPDVPVPAASAAAPPVMFSAFNDLAPPAATRPKRTSTRRKSPGVFNAYNDLLPGAPVPAPTAPAVPAPAAAAAADPTFNSFNDLNAFNDIGQFSGFTFDAPNPLPGAFVDDSA